MNREGYKNRTGHNNSTLTIKYETLINQRIQVSSTVQKRKTKKNSVHAQKERATNIHHDYLLKKEEKKKCEVQITLHLEAITTTDWKASNI